MPYELARQAHLDLYTLMARSRGFEELAKAQVLEGRIRCGWMSGVGQEGILGALCQLRESDYMTYTHRGAYHFIARGCDPRFLLAELFGREDGYCRGKGGRHMADVEHGIYGKSGTIGAHATLAVGMGIAAQLHDEGQIVISVFGDGTSNRGTTHSSMTAAARWQLPIVWLCENNLYAGGMGTADFNPHPAISDLAAGYGIPGVTIDGNDVLVVHERAKEAIERARSGAGPTLIELETYRVEPFSIGMPETRDPQEVAAWRERDPIAGYRDKLLADGVLTKERLHEVDEAVRAEMEAARVFAEASPFPDPAEAFEDLYG